MPTRVGGTRWVAHVLKALDHFLRGYPTIVQHLEQIQSPASVGVWGEQRAKTRQFFKTATSVSVAGFACSLFDIQHHLSALSCNLQRKSLSLVEVHRHIETTKAVLENYKTKPSPKLKQMENKTAFEGVQLTGSDQFFTASRSSLLSYILYLALIGIWGC